MGQKGVFVQDLVLLTKTFCAQVNGKHEKHSESYWWGGQGIPANWPVYDLGPFLLHDAQNMYPQQDFFIIVGNHIRAM